MMKRRAVFLALNPTTAEQEAFKDRAGGVRYAAGCFGDAVRGLFGKKAP